MGARPDHERTSADPWHCEECGSCLSDENLPITTRSRFVEMEALIAESVAVLQRYMFTDVDCGDGYGESYNNDDVCDLLEKYRRFAVGPVGLEPTPKSL